MKSKHETSAEQVADPMVPGPQVRREFSISGPTLWRWARNGTLPPPVRLGGKNYWRRSAIEAVKNGREVSA